MTFGPGASAVDTIAEVTDVPVTPATTRPVSTARVLTTLMVPMFMALLALSVINVALPVIGTALDSDSRGLQWVVSGYALAFGMVPIIGGRLGDDRGRRRVLLVGIAAFVVCSALVGLAPTAGLLLVGRLAVVQGIDGAAYASAASQDRLRTYPIAAVRGEGDLVVSGQDGRNALAVALRIVRSIEESGAPASEP